MDKKVEGVLIRTLMFYANPANWEADNWGVPSIITAEYGKPGRRARNALKKLGIVIPLKKETA